VAGVEEEKDAKTTTRVKQFFQKAMPVSNILV
jgi:hypothetical protein